MQINRLFEMMYLLLDNKKMTAKELAQKFEVSTKTIYRDIEVLSGAKIPIYTKQGLDGGIALHEKNIIDRCILTKNEKSIIKLALNHESENIEKKNIESIFIKLKII